MPIIRNVCVEKLDLESLVFMVSSSKSPQKDTHFKSVEPLNTTLFGKNVLQMELRH